jgi:hypothetical protein
VVVKNEPELSNKIVRKESSLYRPGEFVSKTCESELNDRKTMNKLVKSIESANYLQEGLTERSHVISQGSYPNNINLRERLRPSNSEQGLTTPSTHLPNEHKIFILQRWLANIQKKQKADREAKCAKRTVDLSFPSTHHSNENKIRILESCLTKIGERKTRG